MFQCMTRTVRPALIALAAVGAFAAAGAPGAAAQGAAADVPTYELDPSFPPALPNGWVMGVPTSVAVDARDHVWVLSRPRTVPEELLEQLEAGGRLVLPVGAPGGQSLVSMTRRGTHFERRDLLRVSFVPLVEGIES